MFLRYGLATLAALPLSVPIAGCGAPGRLARPISEAAVMHAFRAATGIEPNVAVSSGPTGYVLDGDFASADDLRTYQKLFGGFSIYVAGPAGRRALADMLRGAPPEGDGIRWRRMSTQGVGVWMAIKRYGANVVLSWVAPPNARTVDGRWRRLDQMLRAVAGHEPQPAVRAG
jgi:hypothetical protein